MSTEALVIIGVDEAGRGALAGPLVVAAAAFSVFESPVTANYHSVHGDKVITVGDSKSFSSANQRDVLDIAVRNIALAVSVVERSAKEIDERLMYHVFPETTKLAVSRVMEQLVKRGIGSRPSDYLVLLDGDLHIPGIPCPVRSIVDGDKRVWQIGAASIVAKVHRDNVMMTLDSRYPGYELDKNKGYPVPTHKKLLKKLGPSPVHRKSFRPVSQAGGPIAGLEDF